MTAGFPHPQESAPLRKVRRSGEHGNGYRHPRPNQEDAEDGEQAHLPRTATSHTKPRIKHPVSLAGPVPRRAGARPGWR